VRRILAVFALLLASLSTTAQTRPANPSGELAHSSYDPAARLEGQTGPKSRVENTLQKINPENKDFGQVIEAARLTALEETVEDFYWWTIVVLCALLILSLAYIWWLVRERAVRLNIAADIVAQLFNSHVRSRAKALEAIGRHNRLAERYNAKCEELTATSAEAFLKEQKKKRKGDVETADKLAENPVEVLETVSGSLMRPSTDRPVEAQNTIAMSGLDGDSEMEIARLNELVRGLQAQAKAQNQKISNLRGQLNRAHDQYKLQTPAEGRG
jgi:hypothetical protein